MTPLILWFRRDFRLDDNPMLAAATATGRPLIPLVIGDEAVLELGAAPCWRMGKAIESFDARLRGQGNRLTLRRGDALSVLRALITESGACGVWWTRLYDPQAIARDTAVKTALTAEGYEARSFEGHTMAEPWQVETGAGGYFKVYTPFFKALDKRGVDRPLPAPARIAAPETWPESERLGDWHLSAAMDRGAAVVARYARIGEATAQMRLDEFLADGIENYREGRDFPMVNAVSGLSENLTYGEISARRIWHAALALETTQPGHSGAIHFRKELAWRDYAHHLMYHTPHILNRNWRPEWQSFAWQTHDDVAETWRRGRTGEAFVDAGMRQMYVTGTMHNRLRMITASYLTKHLMLHWKIGLDWFAECLIDWDPASNAMGWQWVAGSGPDASPFFRVFNPALQAEKFDKSGDYRRNLIAELSDDPFEDARRFFDAAPRSWGLSPRDPYPAPMITLAAGRKRALAAYEAHRARPQAEN
ncbi:cryptochrome/photolyase family protein [Pararhodobacter oceanensis]|uniref:Deoxyribodipyrimidine photolyase n=1 Tax=Pararhodobacter oceanensis TaxID=2172121 RepID=A0A2T8HTW9_9RHOB|nr:deoxyribodipyrimidine photo-lyase [Pararhodobacter oceanensis]PVH28792.1 deoxyribodipyrimidine photolyase [Pararhodobacter oceanensis]